MKSWQNNKSKRNELTCLFFWGRAIFIALVYYVIHQKLFYKYLLQINIFENGKMSKVKYNIWTCDKLHVRLNNKMFS